MMTNKILLFGLAAAVLLSGCVTQEQMDQQTKKINQHTTETIEENTKPVKKYKILNIDYHGDCYNQENAYVGGFNESNYVAFEHHGEVQEYENGRTLILNGIRQFEPGMKSDCHIEHNLTDDERVAKVVTQIETLRYNLTIYDSGNIVHSEISHCSTWDRFEHQPHGRTRFSTAQDMVNDLYEECFEVER